MINEANASSSACRLWRFRQVETSTPPSGKDIIGHPDTAVKAASKNPGRYGSKAGRNTPA